MDISYLPGLSLMLILGISIWIVAKNIRLSAFFLLICGFILSKINFFGIYFTIPVDVLAYTSALAIIMVVFEACSNLAHSDMDTYAEYAYKTSLLILVMNFLFLSLVIHAILHVGGLLSVLVAVILSGIDFVFHDKHHKLLELLKHESVFMAPFVVIIPFILLAVMQLDTTQIFNLSSYVMPLIQKIIVGLGTGILIGILTFHFMKKLKSETLSLILLFPSAILAYVLSENMSGSGVLAVAVFGVFFGKVRMHLKSELKSKSRILTSFMEIFVFIPLGYLLSGVDMGLFLSALLIYLVSLLIRSVAVALNHLNEPMPLQGFFYLVLCSPKGISLGAVALMLSFNLPEQIIGLIVLLIIFSSVLSTVTSVYLNKAVEKS